MKGLIKNYIDKLTTQTLSEFAVKNDIKLSTNELEYLLNLAKNNFDDILVNEDKYLGLVEKNINPTAFIKVKELYLYYRNRYKGYLF
ncbi:MAG: hypothetical protein IJE04_05470 [Bacilli bacterium]|nr:hypothetical protein [Bacilli bacterium]